MGPKLTVIAMPLNGVELLKILAPPPTASIRRRAVVGLNSLAHEVSLSFYSGNQQGSVASYSLPIGTVQHEALSLGLCNPNTLLHGRYGLHQLARDTFGG